MADVKKFTARKLLVQIGTERRAWLVTLLREHRLPHKRASTHQVWQEGFHPQSIFSDAMLLQKLEYLHNNPVRAGYVAAPEHWRYSSAHEWCTGVEPVLRCLDYRTE